VLLDFTSGSLKVDYNGNRTETDAPETENSDKNIYLLDILLEKRDIHKTWECPSTYFAKTISVLENK